MNSSIPNENNHSPVNPPVLRTTNNNPSDAHANNQKTTPRNEAPLKTSLDGLHGRPTQTEIQGMPDDAVSALNKKEIQALVALLPRDHQEALMPSLLALKQIQVAVDKPIRAKIGDEWRDFSHEFRVTSGVFAKFVEAHGYAAQVARQMTELLPRGLHDEAFG